MTRGYKSYTCAGCGKVHHGEYEGDGHWSGSFSLQGASIVLCSGRYEVAPKKSCAQKAYWNLQPCAVCGVQWDELSFEDRRNSGSSAWVPGSICAPCARKVSTAEIAAEGGNLKWAELRQMARTDGNIRLGHDSALEELVGEVLPALLAGRGADFRVAERGYGRVQLLDRQRRALDRLMPAVRQAIAEAWKAGCERGNSLLMGLANGNFTSDAYDAETGKFREVGRD